MPAVPTPFGENGDVDVPALASFCEGANRLGASALVVCGTTGEAPTLSRAEHDQIVRVAADVARGRVPVIAGTGSNSTSQATELSRGAERAGADAALFEIPQFVGLKDASGDLARPLRLRALLRQDFG
jgi:4-hydroxy-tetrahydrodipicolinate synthase